MIHQALTILAACYRSYSLASWIVTRDSKLASWTSGFWQAGFLGRGLWIRGWFPGQAAAGHGSEFYFQRWSGHCLSVYLVSETQGSLIPESIRLESENSMRANSEQIHFPEISFPTNLVRILSLFPVNSLLYLERESSFILCWRFEVG